MKRKNGGKLLLLTFLLFYVDKLPVEVYYGSHQVTATVLDNGEHYGKTYPCTPHTRIRVKGC